MRVQIARFKSSLRILLFCFRRFLRHPLAVLLIGTALSTLLIPRFSERIDRAKLVQEGRLKKSMEIIADNKETERNLNRLLTTLEIFHKDNSGPAARLSNYKKEQKELRRIMVDRYLEFDAQAWWWYSNIYVEARILGIASPQELIRLNQLSDLYGQNLKTSTAVIDDLWNAYLRETYNPSDRRNAELMSLTRNRLDKLNHKRSVLVMQSAQIFAGR
jgi:hypothetical protein